VLCDWSIRHISDASIWVLISMDVTQIPKSLPHQSESEFQKWHRCRKNMRERFVGIRCTRSWCNIYSKYMYTVAICLLLTYACDARPSFSPDCAPSIAHSVWSAADQASLITKEVLHHPSSDLFCLFRLLTNWQDQLRPVVTPTAQDAGSGNYILRLGRRSCDANSADNVFSL